MLNLSKNNQNLVYAYPAYLSFCSGRMLKGLGLGLGLRTYGLGLGLESPGLGLGLKG